jgi:hypothetical protein
VIAKGAEGSRSNCQWNEDSSWRQLIDGKVSKSVTATERISSTVTKNTKGCTAREGRESQDKPTNDELKRKRTAREDEEFP